MFGNFFILFLPIFILKNEHLTSEGAVHHHLSDNRLSNIINNLGHRTGFNGCSTHAVSAAKKKI